MKASILTATTTIAAAAMVIAGIALAQNHVMGQNHTDPTALAIPPAVAASQPGATFALAQERALKPDLVSDAADPTAMAEEKIRKTLAQGVNYAAENVPLVQVASELATKHKINVLIDTRALDDVGLGKDTPVTLNIQSDVALDSALQLMLRQHDLTFTIHEGVLLITTADEAENMLITKVYDVGDLIKFQDKAGEEWIDYDTLIELITSTIEPNSWDEVGGPGAIEASPFGSAEMLTIAQSYQVHKQVGKLLASIREITAQKKIAGVPIREQRPVGMTGGMGMGGMRRPQVQSESTGTEPTKQPPADK